MTFKYWIGLHHGYKETMETETHDEVSIMIEAKNRATADRMVKAILEDAPNVVDYNGVALD